MFCTDARRRRRSSTRRSRSSTSDGAERYGYALIPADAAGVDGARRLGRARHARLRQPLRDASRTCALPAAALRGGFPVGAPTAYMDAQPERRALPRRARRSASPRPRTTQALDGARTRPRRRAARAMLVAESAIDLSAAARRALGALPRTLRRRRAVATDVAALFAEVQAAKTFINEAAVARRRPRARPRRAAPATCSRHPLARAYRDVRAGCLHAPARREPRL